MIRVDQPHTTTTTITEEDVRQETIDILQQLLREGCTYVAFDMSGISGATEDDIEPNLMADFVLIGDENALSEKAIEATIRFLEERQR